MRQVISVGRRVPGGGFTVVELVAVGVCLGLLGLVLLPSLREAVSSSHRLTCLDRLGKIGQASQVYSGYDPTNAAIPVHRLQIRQNPNNPTFIGAYEWGGKSGVGRNNYLPQYAGTIYGSKYGTAAGFGPYTRPLNPFLYPAGFPDNGGVGGDRVDRIGATIDTQLELDAFRCPGDDGPPGGGHCPDWVSRPRQSSYDHFGTSFTANLFMIGGIGAFASNSPYLRPLSRVPNPGNTIAYEENIGRWAWACRRERPECLAILGGYGVDPGPTGSLRGWHGKDWTYNRAFIDAHAESQTVYDEGTEDQYGYGLHYRNDPLPCMPPFGCTNDPDEAPECLTDPGLYESNRCIIVRGDGWQKDTFPEAPVCTGLFYPCNGRPAFECCVHQVQQP